MTIGNDVVVQSVIVVNPMRDCSGIRLKNEEDR